MEPDHYSSTSPLVVSSFFSSSVQSSILICNIKDFFVLSLCSYSIILITSSCPAVSGHVSAFFVRLPYDKLAIAPSQRWILLDPLYKLLGLQQWLSLCFPLPWEIIHLLILDLSPLIMLYTATLEHGLAISALVHALNHLFIVPTRQIYMQPMGSRIGYAHDAAERSSRSWVHLHSQSFGSQSIQKIAWQGRSHPFSPVLTYQAYLWWCLAVAWPHFARSVLRMRYSISRAGWKILSTLHSTLLVQIQRTCSKTSVHA